MSMRLLIVYAPISLALDTARQARFSLRSIRSPHVCCFPPHLLIRSNLSITSEIEQFMLKAKTRKRKGEFSFNNGTAVKRQYLS